MTHDPNARYNPLATTSIAESLARKIQECPCGPLPPSAPFNGAGVYMIYYSGASGAFQAYESLAVANQRACHEPIYVGKAIPKGGRIGVATHDDTGRELYGRLIEHSDSIEAATNLALADFSCRYLVVEHLFVALAEHTLINQFKPVWNYFGGFGNHDPGQGCARQKRSPWDTMHPGRAWARPLPDNPYDAAYWAARFTRHIADARLGAVPPPRFADDLATEVASEDEP